MAHIWGRRSGYVFLPRIDRTNRNRPKFIEGRAYSWPQDIHEIANYLSLPQPEGVDQYFSPGLYSQPQRRRKNLLPERAIWADFDEADPRKFHKLKPSMAWETSPGRFQGVWLLEGKEAGASLEGGLGQAITQATGSDPSGWDSTQLLRIPGRSHYKTEKAHRGKLLWATRKRKTPSQIRRDLTEHLLHTHRVEPNARALLLSQESGGDRSSALWKIERALTEAGIPPNLQYHMLVDSPWNKFGRDSERLLADIHKAWDHKPSRKTQDISPESGVEEDVKPKPKASWWSSHMANPPERPRWLVKNLINRGSCGFISGAPKSYKSYMGLDLLVAVATGKPFLGTFPTEKANVLLLQEEDSFSVVTHRMHQIVEGRSPEHHWHGRMELEGREVLWSPPENLPIAATFQEGFTLSDPEWLVWLSQQIAEVEADLVLIDTLGTTLGNIDIDKSPELYSRVLSPLKRIAHQQDVAILLIHHNRKASKFSSSSGGSSMLGSIALHAWVDNALYFGERSADGAIPVTRESKVAGELAFKVRVPYMYEDLITGARQMWEPEVMIFDEED